MADKHLRLIFDHGEEVFPPYEEPPPLVLDEDSPEPVPIRPDIKINLSQHPDDIDF